MTAFFELYQGAHLSGIYPDVTTLHDLWLDMFWRSKNSEEGIFSE